MKPRKMKMKKAAAVKKMRGGGMAKNPNQMMMKQGGAVKKTMTVAQIRAAAKKKGYKLVKA